MATRRIHPPSYQRLLMEWFALLEYGSFLAATPLLQMMPEGDGHPALVIPGFMGTDHSTHQLRVALRRRGHRVQGWRLGRNDGPHDRVLRGTTRRIEELHAEHGGRVSLVGWSLGGVYARELARERPDLVRQVITLAGPFRFRPGDRGHASALYDAIGPREHPFPGTPEHERPELPVPSTSIYTRTDGIVRWHACIDTVGPLRENIEVLGTHTGLGYNIGAAIAIADRLAQPEDGWEPFRPPIPLGFLYPPPVSWDPAGRAAFEALEALEAFDDADIA